MTHSSGAVYGRTPNLGLGLLEFNFPNWGDDANANTKIIDAGFSVVGIAVKGAWQNSTAYNVGDLVVDIELNSLWRCSLNHVSAAAGTFEDDRAAHPTYWIDASGMLHARGLYTTATTYYANDVTYDTTNKYAWAMSTRQFISTTWAADVAAGDLVIIVDNTQAVTDANAAKIAAQGSATAAAGSATASATSATNSQNSATASATSATNSANSATAAQGYATQALTYSNNASTFATNAQNSATAAANSAAQALAIYNSMYPDAPSDGLVYGRKNAAWSTVIGGAATDDNPPAGPLQDGQLWWKSSTGDMYIWYVDVTGGQWVQVNAAAANMPPVPPSDGGEYVMVNGVWRLSKQNFQPTGAAGQIITVPPTAKMAHIHARLYNATAAAQSAFLRISVDGTTFLSGASDYGAGGIASYSGSTTSPTKYAYANSNQFLLTPAQDVVNFPSIIEAHLVVGKGASPQVFGIQWRGQVYNTAATFLMLEYITMGFVLAAAANAITQMPAFQIVPNAGGWAAGSSITVDWDY